VEPSRASASKLQGVFSRKGVMVALLEPFTRDGRGPRVSLIARRLISLVETKLEAGASWLLDSEPGAENSSTGEILRANQRFPPDLPRPTSDRSPVASQTCGPRARARYRSGHLDMAERRRDATKPPAWVGRRRSRFARVRSRAGSLPVPGEVVVRAGKGCVVDAGRISRDYRQWPIQNPPGSWIAGSRSPDCW
jgi:hypothetical protein